MTTEDKHPSEIRSTLQAIEAKSPQGTSSSLGVETTRFVSILDVESLTRKCGGFYREQETEAPDRKREGPPAHYRTCVPARFDRWTTKLTTL